MNINVNQICSVELCEKPASCRGYCHNHYYRWNKYGDPLAEKKTKWVDLSGQRFGFLVAKTYFLVEKNGRKRGYWNCDCDCGNTTILKPQALISEKIQSCGCRNGKDVETRCILYVERLYIRNAKEGNRKWDLSFDDVKSFIFSDCFFCGRAPSNEIKKINGDCTYNGIDRIDNSGDYTIDNCVACCWVCNQIKGRLPLEVFLDGVRRIASYSGFDREEMEVPSFLDSVMNKEKRVEDYNA